MKGIYITIMIRFPPTAWPALSVPQEPVAGTLDMPYPTDRNMDTRTWQSFIMPVRLTAFTARITTLKMRPFLH